MTYAVQHVDVDGRERLEDVASLEAALSVVEQLQSDGRRSQVRVFKEVPIEVRTYYRVVAVEEPGVSAEAGEGAEWNPGLAQGATLPDQEPDGGDVLPPDPHTVAEDMPPPEPQPEGQRLAPVFQEPPSGAVVMGPPPAQTSPAEGAAAAGESDPEPRRSRFGRS